MRELLALNPPPTAVFAVNDLAALGAMHAIAEAGLRVPDDISVVGFNDLFHASHMTPSLTTMQVPHRAMGAAAAERLLAMVVEGIVPERPLLLPVTLIARQSTGPAPKHQPGGRHRRATSGG
jgi:DNA-binding LacI/PurR family transcriptional regulator